MLCGKARCGAFPTLRNPKGGESRVPGQLHSHHSPLWSTQCMAWATGLQLALGWSTVVEPCSSMGVLHTQGLILQGAENICDSQRKQLMANWPWEGPGGCEMAVGLPHLRSGCTNALWSSIHASTNAFPMPSCRSRDNQRQGPAWVRAS